MKTRDLLGAAALLLAAAAAPAQRIVDLAAGQADLLVRGEAPLFSQLGFSVAAGDVNGDLVDDLVLGAPGHDGPAGAATGAVFVVYGSRSFPPRHVIDLFATPADLTVLGAAAGDLLGASVAAADLDGDGRADLVLGAPSQTGRGKVHAILGAAFPPRHVIDLSATPARVTVIGESGTARLGARVAAGDVNGDTRADLVAATGPGLFLPRVKVHVLHGAAAMPSLVDLDLTPADLTVSIPSDTVLGVLVSLAAARLDPDPIADIVVGLPDASFPPDRFLAGKVLAVRGSAAFPPNHVVDLGAVPPFLEVRGDDAYDRLGSALAVGDFNGGGVPDLAIGAAQGLLPGIGEGKVHVLYGLASPPPSRVVDLDVTRADITFVGVFPGDLTGSALALSDLNGDGRADLAIGLPQVDLPGRPDCGAVLVTYGRSTFPPQAVVRLIQNPGDIVVLGAAFSDRLGFALASGDINGDGRQDLACGAPLADTPAAPDAGVAAVIHGGPLEDSGSHRIGTTVGLLLDFTGEGGLAYLGAGAFSAAAGIPLPGGRRLPVDPDPLFHASVAGLIPSVFVGYAGTLDPSGRAAAALAIPPDPALIGLTVATAFWTLDPGLPFPVRTISNRVVVTIRP